MVPGTCGPRWPYDSAVVKKTQALVTGLPMHSPEHVKDGEALTGLSGARGLRGLRLGKPFISEEQFIHSQTLQVRAELPQTSWRLEI